MRVAAVRSALLSATALLSDAVITGENHDQVGALAWLDETEAASLLGQAPHVTGDVVGHPDLARHLAAVLAELNATAGSASRVERLLVLARRPDLDAGQITDRGYINQRRVLANRADHVALLPREPAPPAVITPTFPQEVTHAV